MAKIRRYNIEDYGQIASWLNGWKIKPPAADTLSDIGYIVDDTACGFLYLTNSSVGLLEGFVSNPKSDKNDRDSAINWITLNLIDHARSEGVKVLKCETKLEEVINRANNFGFNEIGQFKVMMREL
jgi:hypothetical protein